MQGNHLLENEQLIEQLNRTQRELAVLYEVSNAMRTTLELNHILYIILTGVTAHTGLGFNRAVLFLYNPKNRSLEPKMAIGPESGEHAQEIWEYIAATKTNLEDLIHVERLSQNNSSSALFQTIKDLRIPLGHQDQSLLAKAFHEGSPMHIDQQKIRDYQDDPLLKIFKTTELVIMPLKAKDKVKGLIIADNLYTQKPITFEDLKIFIMLANQAGLAIENSQLYEMVIQKSHIDSITNLWNHGFFQDQLGKEIEDVQKKNLPLSLLVIDIDDFKKINDSFGHQNGDIILKEVADLLKSCARENDFVCRYGGEEFTIILPQASKETALNIAERIRTAIATHCFSKLTSDRNISITVSIGVSTLPADADNKESLVTKADKAMYIAKFSGKNQTCLTS